jgi:hypothetical protein
MTRLALVPVPRTPTPPGNLPRVSVFCSRAALPVCWRCRSCQSPGGHAAVSHCYVCECVMYVKMPVSLPELQAAQTYTQPGRRNQRRAGCGADSVSWLFQRARVATQTGAGRVCSSAPTLHPLQEQPQSWRRPPATHTGGTVAGNELQQDCRAVTNDKFLALFVGDVCVSLDRDA